MNDVLLPESALNETTSGLAEVATEFADEIGGAPTLAEFLEILGWAVPVNSDVLDGGFPEPLTFKASLPGNKRYESTSPQSSVVSPRTGG